MDFSKQITILQENMLNSQNKRESKFKNFTSDKWRAMMIRALQKMKRKDIYDSNLIFDLSLIVQSIKDAHFVEAILNIEPFRPNFSLRKRQNNQKKFKEVENIESFDQQKPKTRLASVNSFEYRHSIIKLKRSINQKLNEGFSQIRQKHKKSLLQQLICYVTEEETLIKEFEAKFHPFRKIIEQYLFLLENKYKNMIEYESTVNIEQVQQKLIIDIRLLQQFIIKSSQPYITIFKSENQDQKVQFQIKMVAFLKQYIQKHEKINIIIRKIMRLASRKTKLLLQLSQNIPNFVEVGDFQIKESFEIEGCYIQSMNVLMQFAQGLNSKSSLKKLKQFRECLSKDADDYYENKEKVPMNREICAEMQIQIIKFILAKLKPFLGEIFAQLKFLEVVYGESDMSFKYDDSSYMYAQISIALEALQLDYS